ncbi:MAG: hypothetical protein VZS44_06725 [Bacilli bacterium]|nr:hypothetical protein [Bacilli bacterium]
MKKYDLNDIYNKERTCKIVKKRLKKYLGSHKEEIIDMKDLLDIIYKSIIEDVLESYKNGDNNNKTYKDDDIQKMHTSIIEYCFYNEVNNTFSLENNIVLKRVNEHFGELIKNRLKEVLLSYNSLIEECIFEKLPNNKVKVQDWIKPYLSNVSFENIFINYLNVKNYDYSGIKNIKIDINQIEGNTLENTVLRGIEFINKSKDNNCIIDPTKINIKGADFTGSKGAIIALNNIDKLPEGCNLTDTKIIVNSKEDIKRLNLEKYKNNIYVKQNSITNGDIIKIDFNDYISYTGIIDKKEYDTIKEALKLDCLNNDGIRKEMNKIIAYNITKEISEIINFEKLYNYISDIIYINRETDWIMEEDISNSNNPFNLINGEYNISLKKLIDYLGSPLEDDAKMVINNNNIEFITKNGILAIDLLRLGFTKDEIEMIDNGIIIPNVNDRLEVFIKLLNKIYNKLYEYVYKEEELVDYINDVNLKNYFIKTLEKLIYNNLGHNNKGYSEELKQLKIKRRRKHKNNQREEK